jgi:predicted RNA binding protein YcfA (HicA-like mRNA interferase family)
VTLIPSLSDNAVISALERARWRVDRQKGSHIRLSRFADGRLRKLTVPAYRPLKRSTLAKIIKQANLSVEEFLDLLN